MSNVTEMTEKKPVDLLAGLVKEWYDKHMTLIASAQLLRNQNNARDIVLAKAECYEDAFSSCKAIVDMIVESEKESELKKDSAKK